MLSKLSTFFSSSQDEDSFGTGVSLRDIARNIAAMPTMFGKGDLQKCIRHHCIYNILKLLIMTQLYDDHCMLPVAHLWDGSSIQLELFPV